jgi:hypothetical protein
MRKHTFVIKAMKNPIRNVILIRVKSKNTLLQLISNDVDLPNFVCLSCELEFEANCRLLDYAE